MRAECPAGEQGAQQQQHQQQQQQQGGGNQPPLAYNNAAQFIAAWDISPTDQARDNLEQEAITRSPAQDVQLAANGED
jgi:hypothetical protein